MPTVMEEEDATGVVEVAEGLEVVAECIMGTYDDDPVKRQEAWDNLVRFAELHPEDFAKFSSEETWTALLEQTRFTSTPEAVAVVKLSLKKLSFEPQQALRKTLQQFLPLHLQFFYENIGQQREEYEKMKQGALVVCSLIMNQPDLLPENVTDMQSTALRLFEVIASLPETEMTLQYQEQVAKLAEVLFLMMNKHNVVFEVILNRLHQELKTLNQHPPTSFTFLLVKLPWDRAPSLIEENAETVMEALLRLLCSFPAIQLKKLIDHLLNLLSKQVLKIKLIAAEVLSELLFAMLEPITRVLVQPIFFNLLYGSQTSARAFNKLLPYLYSGINRLAATAIDNGAGNLLEELLEAAVFHYFRFPGLAFPNELKDILHPSMMISTKRWCELASKALVGSYQELPARGLVNLGNTCYLNSVVQALRFTPVLVEHLQRMEEDVLAAQPVLYRLRQLVSCLTSEEEAGGPTVSPWDFLIASRPSWFAEGEQQDCSEFLTAMLAALHEEQWREESKKKEVLENILMNKTEEATSAVKETTDSVVKVQEEEFLSLVREVFGGKMKSSYRCHDCHTVSTSVDWFTDLHIPVPEQVHLLEEGLVPPLEHLPGITITSTKELKEVATPLESLLEVALCDELLEDNNKYHCDVCNGLRDATRSSKIIQTPNVLILVLLRFKYDAASQCRKKLTSLVDYPDTLTFGGESYSLRNVVVHSGCDSGEGHYYTWARREEATWLVLSDCQVREESWNSFLESPEHQKNDTPYLLFYAKKAAEEELLSSKENDDRGNMDVATDLTPPATPIISD